MNQRQFTDEEIGRMGEEMFDNFKLEKGNRLHILLAIIIKTQLMDIVLPMAQMDCPTTIRILRSMADMLEKVHLAAVPSQGNG